MILSEVLINGVTWLLKLKYTVSCITNACKYVNVPEVIHTCTIRHFTGYNNQCKIP